MGNAKRLTLMVLLLTVVGVTGCGSRRHDDVLRPRGGRGDWVGVYGDRGVEVKVKVKKAKKDKKDKKHGKKGKKGGHDGFDEVL